MSQSANKVAPENKKWWADGVRFACQGSGKCCVSRGEFGFVYLTLADRRLAAKLVGTTTAAFTRKYCAMTDGVWHLKEGGRDECIFLDGKRCSIYEARPVQCRTWPFWPEVMNAKSWATEVKAFCPGVGKGPRISAEKIQATLDEQSAWEKDLQSGL